LGLYGVTSPLPTAYAETIAQADPDNTRLRDFLDLFHHRLLSLLYRAWSRQHYIVEFAADGTDTLSQRLLVWLGIDRRLADALGMAPVELLRHASLFVGRTRSRRALETFFRELAGVPVAIQPNIGRWVEIPEDQRARLGRQSMTLGRDFVIGRRVFDRSGKFRIILGPVDYDTYETFLPGAAASHRLDVAVRAVLTSPLAYEIELRVRASDRARFQLGRNRLGWDAWAGNKQNEAAVLFQAAGGSR
jgi:type VI secretion system protein ImpH